MSTARTVALYFAFCLVFFAGALLGSASGGALVEPSIALSVAIIFILILMGMYHLGKRSR